MMLASLVLMALLTVDNALPAGNIVYERTEGDTVYVHQELRDTEGDWFYWAMRVKGAAGRTLNFAFTKSDAVGVRGPAVSRDKGGTFAYAAEKGATRKSFTYTFGADEDETWFYECIPYLPDDWTRFLKKHGRFAGTRYEADVLCTSKKGAKVPMARFGCLTGTPKHKVFLTSRHHCSETMATFVLEGVAAAFLADDELGAWLRENVELTVVPFVDYDGSVAGDQGKNRQPYDHNRDYTALTHPEIRAIVELVPKLAPDMWIDVHCPWLYGGVNEKLSTPLKDPNLPYNHPENEARFSSLLEKLQCGSMRYRAADDTPWGRDWNTDKNYIKGMSCIRWAMSNIPSVKICRTYEVPFANANGAVVTGESCRALGRDTAKVIRAFWTAPHASQERGFVQAERATPEMIAEGKTPGLVDSRTGERVQLRGVNAGGWLVTENWMCPTGPGSNKVGRCQYELADAFRAKFGAEKAEELWDLYRANWWREEDFANVRELGLNCIRLPFGWRELMTSEGEPIEKGLKRIDWFVEGCRANDLYVILDLHGAPGGQNGRDHSGDVREHRLVSDPAAQDLCAKLWTTLAARYRNDTTVAGYDFLNEPEGAPGGLTSTNGVMQIYDRLYKAVRAVDPDHLIFLGACWTPEHIDPPAVHGWENVCYEYHFYEWGKKTAAEINAGTDDRVKWERAKGHHVPVFVGEFNLFDSTEAWEYGLKTFDELGWSWAIWTYKVTGPHMNWGLYQGLGRTAPFKATPDDDFETIKRKWSRLGTSDSFMLQPYARLLKMPRTEARPQLLIDTDMMTDCDDVAALELAYACERKGLADVLAVVVSASYPKSVPVVEAVNAYCGRASLPVGAPKNGTGFRREDSCFLDKVAAEYPHVHASNDEARDAVEVMRRTLAAAEDGSVTLVTLGYLSNVATLLRIGPDAVCELDGRTLLARKVKEWVCMGGNFPNDPANDNVNFTRDAPAALFSITNYPGRITFVGREIGHKIYIGNRFHELPAANPLRRAYELHRGRYGTNWDHHTADPTTILYAVYGAGERFGRVEGTLHLQPNCAFTWDPDTPSNMSYLTQREPRAVTAKAMEALLLENDGAH